MRITLRLDDDIHLAAKELAKAEGKTLGQVISSLTRKTLLPETLALRRRSRIPTLADSSKPDWT